MYKGNIRIELENRLIGWLQRNEKGSLSLIVAIDGKCIAEIRADSYRPDIASSVGGDGYCGIDFFFKDFRQLGSQSISVFCFDDMITLDEARLIEFNTMKSRAAWHKELKLTQLEHDIWPSLNKEENGLKIVETIRGPILINMNDYSTDYDLRKYGEFSEVEFQLLEHLCANGGTVVDAGANQGYFTVSLAKSLGKRGNVVAIEAMRMTYYKLCANIVLNGCSNAFAHNVVLGKSGGSVHVPVIDYSTFVLSGGVSLLDTEVGEEAPTTALDDLVAGQPVSLIKIDVEGMEAKVLAGAQKTIMDHSPKIYFECIDRDNFAAFCEFLLPLGYSLYWHAPPLFRPDNYNGCTEDRFGGEGISANILALPNGYAMPEGFGLVPYEDGEFWPAHKFEPAYQSKIANLSK